ncbi:MAG TPA: periplasmic heavy metal sensor [Alphaproteobacteria bacterium]|nr:periplasmic heavy metal sensor [Alphaproteobacteria bacterium]
MVNDAPKRRPWILIALIGSLGLNLFLGGLMVGRWVSGPPHRHVAMAERVPGGEPGRFLNRMASSLPPEHRPVFEGVISKHQDRVAELANQARAAREQVRDVLGKEPFDRAALDRAFETVRARNMALQSEVQMAIAEAAAGLPPEARQRLADWRAHGRRR